MKILLTNDDGFDSEGIQRLAQVLRGGGKHRVTIIAPDSNRSGVSHAISILNSPLKIVKKGEDDFTCSGFPADCVIIGLRGGLVERPDIVLSGINRGENLGTDIVYSGTAAAARQAGLAGVPAVALSLVGRENFYWDMAASWAADNLDELLGFWKNDCFVNVNIPNSPEGPLGMFVSTPEHRVYKDALTAMDAPDGNRWYFMEAEAQPQQWREDSDCHAVSRNYASVSSVYCHPIAHN